MQTKTLNTIVFTVSQVLNLLIILYFAVLLAKLVWWVINPTLGDVYIEKSSATEFEKSAKYISNRNPFGIITKPMESATVVPTIASQITLSGVYFSPPKSMAFITYNNNPLVVKVGGSIAGNATIKEIFVDHIIVSQNGAEANVNMVDADPDNSYAPDSTQDDQPAQEPTRKSNASMNNSKRNTTPNISATKNNNDLQERRRKLISNFAQKTANPTDNNANSQTPGSNQEPIPGSVPGAIPGAINTNNRMNGNENNNNSFNNENKNHNNQENNNNNLNNNQENNRSLNNNSNGSNANQNNS